MLKRFIFIPVISIYVLFLGLKLARSEQGYYGKEKTASLTAPAIKKTAETQAVSTDASSNQEKTNQKILNKLDQVLSNQEKIMEELKIIKVRASRK